MLTLLYRFFPPIFLVWWFTDVGYSFAQRSAENTHFLWLNNLVLLGTAIGLAAKNRNLLVSTLGLYLIAVLPWHLDNALRPILQFNPLGVNENLYRPGITAGEFFLAHSYWFTLPALWYGVRNAPQGKWHPLVSCFILLSVLVLSFFYGPVKNLNCVHYPCFPLFSQWQGSAYTIGFIALFLCLHFLVSQGLNKCIRFNPTENPQLLIFLIFLPSAFILFDYWYLKRLPQLTCEAPFENKEIRARCLYTTDYADNWFTLTYALMNKSRRVIDCTSYLETGGNKKLLQDSLVIWPKQELEFDTLWPYPKTDQSIRISAECKSYLDE